MNRMLSMEKAAEIRKEFRFPYVLTYKDMEEKVRQRSSSGCTKRAWDYLKERWGIDENRLLVNDNWTFCPQGLFLPRQIARPDLETLFAIAIARAGAMDWGVLSLTFDPWMPQPYKSSLVEPVTWAKDVQSINKRNFPAPRPYQSLRDVITDEGEGIVPYYMDRFYETFFDFDALERDLSPVYSEIVLMNIRWGKEKIPTIFVEETDEKAVMIRPYDYVPALRKYGPYTLEDVERLAAAGKARPAASWNYAEFYLMMPGILYPELLFAVTPWECDGAKIQTMVRPAYKKIESITGTYPLCVPFPPLSLFAPQEIKGRLGKYPEYANISTTDVSSLLPDFAEEDIWALGFRIINALAEIIKSSKKRF